MKIKPLITLFFCLIMLACGNRSERSYQGYIEGMNIYLASPNSGNLETLAVSRGQLVKKGQFLYQLDSNPEKLYISQYTSDLQQARNILNDLEKPRRQPEIAAIEAQIAQIDTQIKLAELRVKRYQELYNKQAASKDVVDEALAKYQEQLKLKTQYQSNLKLAKLGSREEQINAQKALINSLIAKLNSAQWQLDQKKAYAPADGLIFDTYFSVGEFVGPQKPILSLLTPNNVRVEFFIPVTELAHIRLGQNIDFQCLGCPHKEKAIISYISPEAQFIPPLVYSRENDDKLVYRVKADLRQFNQFKPGQPVMVFIP